jgi:ADP-ribosylglycohydrolase
MLGAITGDIIGSVYECFPTKDYDFPLFPPNSTFTDDTVLTIAVAEAILTSTDYANSMKNIGRQYPSAGYGLMFMQWLNSLRSEPYNSWGNGSAMRVSPVGFAFDNIDQVLEEAKKTAEVTHNHPEGIKGAQATALAVYLAKTGNSKSTIRAEISSRFKYDLSRTLEEIRPGYMFYASCQQTVPEAIIAFLESTDYEDAIRNSVSLGGDSDTLACITGGIAQAFYKKIPEIIKEKVYQILPDNFSEVINLFNTRYEIEI